MSHYAKLATLAFRVVAVMLLAYGLLASVVLARVAVGVRSAAMMLPGVAAFVIAMLLYFAAPFLGRFAALGLNPPDRTA